MNQIAELRHSAGISQSELANLVGVNQTAVSQWERGVTNPSPSILLNLCNIFNTTTDYLLGRKSDFNSNLMKWQDPETMDVVREELSPLLAHLQRQLETFSDFEQKMAFDVFVEMSHAFNCAGDPDPDRRTYLETLQQAFFITNNYLDCLLRSAGNSDFEADRIQQAQAKAAGDYAKALLDAIKMFSESE